MSEARPEKHDDRRHDSPDGVVLPNLSRFSKPSLDGTAIVRLRPRSMPALCADTAWSVAMGEGANIGRFE